MRLAKEIAGDAPGFSLQRDFRQRFWHRDDKIDISVFEQGIRRPPRKITFLTYVQWPNSVAGCSIRPCGFGQDLQAGLFYVGPCHMINRKGKCCRRRKERRFAIYRLVLSEQSDVGVSVIAEPHNHWARWIPRVCPSMIEFMQGRASIHQFEARG